MLLCVQFFSKNQRQTEYFIVECSRTHNDWHKFESPSPAAAVIHWGKCDVTEPISEIGRDRLYHPAQLYCGFSNLNGIPLVV